MKTIYPFLRARWYTKGPRDSPVDLIVIHDAEYPEELDGAEAVAKYFQRVDRKASAHFVCDADSTVQCVALDDVAYHAPGANHNGVGIELCGYAKQTMADWLDDYGVRMLRDQAAPLVRDLLDEFQIPLTWLNVDDLKRSRPRGVTSHWNVSLAYRRSTHTDPGSGFPVGQFIDWCRKPAPATQEDDDEMIIWRPVGKQEGKPETGWKAGEKSDPNVGGHFLEKGDKLISLSGDHLQQLANGAAGGHVDRLRIVDAQRELWAQMTKPGALQIVE